MHDVFWAMMAIDGSRAYLVGRDNWRKDITNAEGRKIDSLEGFGSDLTIEVLRQSKSKGGKWSNPKEWNLWTAVHNGLLLPILGQVLGAYGNTKVRLTYKETEQFFSPLPYMINHCKEYQELKAEYHYQGKEDAQIKKEWDDRLEGYFRHVDIKAPISEILDKLPDDLRRKVDTSLRHSGDPKPENDSLVGRMICAYLATKGASWKKLGMEPRIEDYLKPLPDAPASYEVKPLYARLLDVHVESVPQLIKDLPVLDYNSDTKIPLSDYSKLYRWYGTGTVVETVKPDLVGAGHLGFKELAAFCRYMETKHGLNYHNTTVMTDSINLFRSTQSLERIGRLSLIQDIIESTYEDEQKDGERLRALASRLWSDDERAAAWGNTTRYVPESRSGLRDFSLFKSDIANIIYCAGLFEERRGDQERAASLKALAYKVKDADDSLRSLRDVIQDKADIINDWVAQWEKRYPESERVRAARFVQQTFGLAPVKPVPIKMDEINLGIKGSGYGPDKRTYHVKYREAKDMIETDILAPGKLPKETVKYNTVTESGVPVLEIKRNNGAQVSIPVPARGSYDPFGTTGSQHGGEIIGFGCSVHHASLAFMLAELAALGAERTALQSLADKFMEINPGKHLRKTFANFQVEQVWTAFNEGRSFTYAEYLQKNPGIKNELLSHPGHEHTIEYLGSSDKEPLAAYATRARLSYGYADVYPPDAEDAGRIGARDSWYVTDVNARL